MTEIAELAHEVRSLRSEVSRMLGTRLTKAEMAKRLGVSYPTLRDWVAKGKVPPPGLGGKWMLADVQEWEFLQKPRNL